MQVYAIQPAASARLSRRAEACAAPSGRAASAAHATAESPGVVGRRGALLAASSATLMMANTPAIASTDVGSYLPKAGVEDFVLFVPDKQKTPAIRAGTVDPSKPYSFALPPSWSERKVANIASGTIPATDSMSFSGLHTVLQDHTCICTWVFLTDCIVWSALLQLYI